MEKYECEVGLDWDGWWKEDSHIKVVKYLYYFYFNKNIYQKYLKYIYSIYLKITISHTFENRKNSESFNEDSKYTQLLINKIIKKNGGT